ncbi:SGNH/GDSL hydrolase family protein [Aphanothece hegewaldii]|uniref:SGNH/GDSL hydrolase family protein n=1 Tax=Aphanothece hegewaldii TaxID=1521625 RepID=UPI0015E7182E|nr:SGNH/GDSL hydrolase family protein [Aphanothece hegewaldii]
MKKISKNLKKFIFSVALGQLFLSSLPAEASQLVKANSISQLFVFGDSLVDDGNLYDLTNGESPPSSLGYFNGRFSNGKVFVENLPEDLKNNGFGQATLEYNSANNYAIAGSGINYNYFLENSMGLDYQINSFLSAQFSPSSQALGIFSTPSIDPDALYLIAVGSNDYYPDEDGNLSFDVETVVGKITESITQLANAGAKNFAIAGIPDLTIAPALNGISEDEKEFLKNLSRQHNLTLQIALDSLQQEQELDITFLDFNRFLKKSFNNFANIQDACLNLATANQCSDPNDYLFWDDIHLTSYAHTILAQRSVEVYGESNSISVPEPQAVFGLFVVAGVSLLLRNKPK